MKKSFLFLVFVAMISASCMKEYRCICKDANGAIVEDEEYTAMSRWHGKGSCEMLEELLSSSSNPVTCELQ
jgi:hypothetical protein